MTIKRIFVIFISLIIHPLMNAQSIQSSLLNHNKMKSKIETVQQCYAEFGKGNVQGVLDLLSEDIVWTDPGYPAIPYAGKRQGKNEVMNFFVEMSKFITFTKFEPQVFLQDGDQIIVRGYFTGKGNASGKSFESEWVMIWEVVKDKVKNYQAYIDTNKIVMALN